MNTQESSIGFSGALAVLSVNAGSRNRAAGFPWLAWWQWSGPACDGLRRRGSCRASSRRRAEAPRDGPSRSGSTHRWAGRCGPVGNSRDDGARRRWWTGDAPAPRRAGGPFLESGSGLEDAGDLLGWQSVGTAQWCRRPILEAGHAVLPVAADPLVSRGPGDARGLGRLGNRPPEILHPLADEKPSERRELRPTMGHESLLPRLGLWSAPNRAGGSRRVNNLRGNYI